MSFEHLHPSAAEVVNKSIEEKIAWINKPRWIGYPRAHELLGKLDDLIQYPRDVRMPNMLLIGGSNNGKTKLIKKFAEKHPINENTNGEFIIAPVLYCQATPSPSEAGFYTEILSSLFERVPASSVDAKRARVITVLRGIQLKVLIIDELHNILAGASVKQQHFLNMIKYLSNELNISIVGCGTGDLLRAVSIDPQIQNRFTPEILPKWEMSKEFRQLLMSFERVLPLKNASKLHDPEIARKILATCEGTIGELSTLLNKSAIFALKNGQEEITTEIINICGYTSPSERTRLASRA